MFDQNINDHAFRLIPCFYRCEKFSALMHIKDFFFLSMGFSHCIEYTAWLPSRCYC